MCGSRDWTCVATVQAWMRPLYDLASRRGESFTLINGKAPGVDTIAGNIARQWGADVEEYPADWDGLGNGAGPIRNRQMQREGRPTRALAFGLLVKHRTGSLVRLTGTGDMVSVLNDAGILVTVVPKAGVMP